MHQIATGAVSSAAEEDGSKIFEDELRKLAQV
jgi:hypothetical protein